MEHGVEAVEEAGVDGEAFGVAAPVVDEAAAGGVDFVGSEMRGVGVGGGEWPAVWGDFAGEGVGGEDVGPEVLDGGGAGEDGSEADDGDLGVRGQGGLRGGLRDLVYG